MTTHPMDTAPRADASNSLAHTLHSLLSCMRCIAQHEDALCELLHEIEQNGVTRVAKRELLALADELPGYDYVGELDALRDMLGTGQTAAGTGRGRRKGVKLSAAKRSAQTKAKRAKQVSGRSKVRKTGRKPSR